MSGLFAAPSIFCTRAFVATASTGAGAGSLRNA